MKMKTATATTFYKVCEILVYANTEEINGSLHVCTEFGAANLEILNKAN